MLASSGHRNGEIFIRAYRKEDRATICRLCCETGFLGNPVDALFQDRELFADLFTRPYLDYEPESSFVAESHGEVVGYLLGAANRHFEMFLLERGFRTTSKMLLRLASGRYAGHPRSRQFVRWLLTAALREQPRHPREAAHLHMQVGEGHYGRRVPYMLWDAFHAKLRSLAIKRCYGVFFSHPRRRPERVYSRYGFEVFDRRRTTLFAPEVAEPVEVVCVWKTL